MTSSNGVAESSSGTAMNLSGYSISTKDNVAKSTYDAYRTQMLN